MAFIDELTTLLDGFRNSQTILDYQVSDINETRNTGMAVVLVLNTTTDKVEEVYYFVWKWNNVMKYKKMDRLPRNI